MKIFIDCEWNGWGGNLISMALCAEDGSEFYEVLHCYSPTPWVKTNVVPNLNKGPINPVAFQSRLQDFLITFDSVHIIADWPEDLQHFCRVLITGPGKCMNTPHYFLEVQDISSISALPHNALEDARALRGAYLNL